MTYNIEEGTEYRKTALVKARVASDGGIIDTLEGPHTYEKGDYIAGPGAAGEFWPVKKAIFEQTYEIIPKICEAGKRGCENIGEYGPDPFASDVNDDHTPVWECEDCRYESAQDI